MKLGSLLLIDTAQSAIVSTDTGTSSRIAAALGIGTTLPAAGLDVALTGSAYSAIIVPRDTTANRPATAINGMIRYNTNASALEAYVNGGWQQISVQPVGSTTNVTASGPPVNANIFGYSVTANYTPAFGSINNIKNGTWPANGTSDSNNGSCVNLYDTTTSPQQAIILDLGSTKTIGNVYASIDGHFQVETLAMAFSVDGTNYTNSASIAYGNVVGAAYYVTSALAPSVSARYVRLTNSGSAGSSYYDRDTVCQVAVGP